MLTRSLGFASIDVPAAPNPTGKPPCSQREIDPEIRADIEKFEVQLGPVPRRRPRGGRLPGLPPEQRHLRPAPGRPQPDGAGEGPVRRRSRPSSSTCSPTSPRPTAAAGATSPPARTCSSTSWSSSRSPPSCGTWPRSGLTTREACGDTVRNVQGCHLAGACPYEALDISPWAEAAFQHFLRHPLAQRLPRKFKINFSGCETDCGQAMFNDVGVIATTRTLRRRHPRGRLPGVRRRRPRRQPAPRARPRGVHAPRGPAWPPSRRSSGCSRNHGNRDNKLRARMKWLVDTMGWDELQARILKERKLPRRLAPPGPAASPTTVEKHGDAPAGLGHRRHPDRRSARARRSRIRRNDPYERWDDANVVRGVAKGTVSAIAYARLGDITTAQFRALASIQRELGAEVRITNRQNLVFRGLTEAPAAHAATSASTPSAWPSPAPSWPATSSPAPAPTPATWPSPRAAAWPTPSAPPSTRPAWPTSAASAPTSPAAPTAAASTTSPTSASSAPSAGPTASRPPATRCCSAATSARRRSTSARRRCASRPRTPPRPPCGSCAGSPTSARPARPSARGWTASGGAKAIAEDLKDLDEFPLPDDGPEYYVDYGETGPYVAETGESECAT